MKKIIQKIVKFKGKYDLQYVFLGKFSERNTVRRKSFYTVNYGWSYGKAENLNKNVWSRKVRIATEDARLARDTLNTISFVIKKNFAY